MFEKDFIFKMVSCRYKVYIEEVNLIKNSSNVVLAVTNKKF